MDFVQNMQHLAQQTTQTMLEQAQQLVDLIRSGTAVAERVHQQCETDAQSRRAYFEAGQAFWLHEARRTT
jgi:hypothetical protein